MWYYGKPVQNVSSYSSTKWCHAIIGGIPDLTGWIRIAPTSADGVTNIVGILAGAKVSGRNVNVNIENGQIIGVYMS